MIRDNNACVDNTPTGTREKASTLLILSACWGLIANTLNATETHGSVHLNVAPTVNKEVRSPTTTNASPAAPNTVRAHDPLNIRLYTQKKNLVLRLSNGYSVPFVPGNNDSLRQPEDRQVYSHRAMGTIETEGSHHLWRSAHTVNIEFLGSYPVAVSSREHRIELRYRNRVLDDAIYTNERSTRQDIRNPLEFARLLVAATEKSACPDQALEPPVESAREPAHEPCADPNAPLPVGFGVPLITGDTHINTRPSDCHSFFTAYPSIERGTEIEAALSAHAPYVGSESGAHSFPVADFWNNGNVYVLISRDLSANTYLDTINRDGFYEQLIADGENINENLLQVLLSDGQISHTSGGRTTTLHASQAQVIHLDVVVQFGVISKAQRRQFDRAAKELQSQYGIVARLVMIP